MLSKFTVLSALSFLRKSSSQKRTRSHRRRLEFENLEPRNMLTGIFLDPATGDLTVWGDEGNNNLVVTVSGAQYQAAVDNQTESYPAADVNRVVFIGFGGNDTIRNITSLPGTLLGNGGDDRLFGGSNDDLLNGGEGDDTLVGGAGDDTLVGFNGADIMEGDAGDDVLIAGDGANVMSGGAGDDLLFGGKDVDIMDGGDGVDVLVGFEGDDVMNTGRGGEIVPEANPELLPDNGWSNDRVDLAFGLDGNDQITGGGGLDLIYAGNGDDTVIGGNGQNRVFGQAGDDVITGGNVGDFIWGGTEEDEISGGGGADWINGGNDNDILRGGSGGDGIFGGFGDDSLYGEEGLDALFGEGGNDGLFGGRAHNDELNGGGGADRFLNYAPIPDSAVDFNAGAGDRNINFANDGSSTWATNKQIEVVDIGLRALHHRTGSTLVFKDPLDENPMTITKAVPGTLGGDVDGSNGLEWQFIGFADGEIESETYTRTIKIAEWDTGDERQNNIVSLAIIHEIAHSFDSAFEINQLVPGRGALHDSFLDISGWENSNPGAGHIRAAGVTQEPFDRTFNGTQYVLNTRAWWYDSGSEFARPYGIFTPAEDWATVWESLFVSEIVDEPSEAFSQPIAAKVSVVNRLLSSLR